jgi:Ca-activated chloride channel homolog
MIILTFLIIASPYAYREKKVPVGGEKNIVLILDISKSMLADDIAPNRLDRAKEVIREFLGKWEGVRFGLIVFAGKPFVLSPLTDDIWWLQEIVDTLTTDTIRQNLPWLSGTNIGDALLLSPTLSSSWQSQTVILITDGRANIGTDPITALDYLSRQSPHPIYTIGIGNASGAVLSYLRSDGERQYFYDEQWEKLRADIDADTLEKIARKSGGVFYHASESQIFDEIFDTLGRDFFDTRAFVTEKSWYSLVPLFFGMLVFLALTHGLLVFFLRRN